MVVAEISSISAHGLAPPYLLRQALGLIQMLGLINGATPRDHSTATYIDPVV